MAALNQISCALGGPGNWLPWRAAAVAASRHEGLLRGWRGGLAVGLVRLGCGETGETGERLRGLAAGLDAPLRQVGEPTTAPGAVAAAAAAAMFLMLWLMALKSSTAEASASAASAAEAAAASSAAAAACCCRRDESPAW